MFCAVDTCVPGDMVTVSGIVKVTNSDEGIVHTDSRLRFIFILSYRYNLSINICVYTGGIFCH